MAIEVELRERTNEIWLSVDYDGLVPPVLLFDDLAMIGWRPPAPTPPPASAIDWSTPDPVAGTSHSVRSYRVTGARVEAPPGSGPRGAWTPADRHAHLLPLRGVLARHGLALEDAEAVTEVEAFALLPAPPGGVTDLVLVGVTVVDAFASVVLGRLRDEGLDPSTTPATVSRTIAFRGNRQEVEEAATRIEVVVGAGGAATVERLMGGEGVEVRPVPPTAAGLSPDAPRLHSVA